MSSSLTKLVERRIAIQFAKLKREAPAIGRSAGAILTRAVKDKVRDADAIASGRFLNSIRTTVEIRQTRQQLSEIRLIVGSDVFYSRFVIGGRRPGRMPPVEAIQRWIVLKGLLHLNAFLVARAIGKRGIRARNFYDRGWRASRDRIEAAVRRRLIDALVLP